MTPLETFWFTGANDDKIQGFLVKPPNFDPNKKYPVKFIIHGGSEVPMGDELSSAGIRSYSPQMATSLSGLPSTVRPDTDKSSLTQSTAIGAALRWKICGPGTKPVGGAQ